MALSRSVPLQHPLRCGAGYRKTCHPASAAIASGSSPKQGPTGRSTAAFAVAAMISTTERFAWVSLPAPPGRLPRCWLRCQSGGATLSTKRDRSMSTGLYVALGIIVLLVIIVIGIYNGLVAGRQEVRNAWSQIDIQLKRRHDLIPNLVNAVKDAMQVEKAQLTAVIAARNQAVSARTSDEAMKAENNLTGMLRQLFALVESYPQLRSQQNVSGLMEELSTTENRISFARQHYNDAVQAQNIRVASFPGVLLASSLGFTARRCTRCPRPSAPRPRLCRTCASPDRRPWLIRRPRSTTPISAARSRGTSAIRSCCSSSCC